MWALLEASVISTPSLIHLQTFMGRLLRARPMMGTRNRKEPSLVSDLEELSDGGRQIVQHSMIMGLTQGTGGAHKREPWLHNVALFDY